MGAPPRSELLRVVAAELSLPLPAVTATVGMFGDGNTVPFIARYRKEATGGLDEVQIRAVLERWEAREKLEERRAAILRSLTEGGHLTPVLEKAVASAYSLASLEDVYRPFKPKRRTRAQIAQERGLGPLAALLLRPPAEPEPLRAAAAFVDAGKGVATPHDALAGARDIVAEQVADFPHVRGGLRQQTLQHGLLVASKAAKATSERTKFEEYYDYREPLRRVPSHRFLAVRRGEGEGVLRYKVEVDDATVLTPLVRRLLDHMGGRRNTAWGAELEAAVRDGVERIALAGAQSEVLGELKDKADVEAIDVFARNLSELLLAAPLGPHPVVGIDPGLRTGSKCVAVDERGRYRGTVTLYLAGSPQGRARAADELDGFLRRHQPRAIAVGNGTGGRETFAFAREVVQAAGLDIPVVSVSEAGASVYSASDLAREEFPELDLTLRGAISIARRLQDPLAELVKVDPKSIGVGQYQHDVNQPQLRRKLDEVVETCVNRVGVDINTASAPLLAYVSGVGPKLAAAIVAYREEHGSFRSRKQLRSISGLGPKTFEQAAGFLRIRGGDEPLDGSAVHPERYGLVHTMAADAGLALASILGRPEVVSRLDWRRYVGGEVGEPTLRDILDELGRPGRDPRAEFEPPRFRDDVRELSDVCVGMELEGVVTNVTHFGAFVDVGVHQDGLVHISKLSSRFVRDPHEVVRAGDRVCVRVLEVDLSRRRLAFERVER